MAVHLVKDKSTIEKLFAGWAEGCVWSCLQDCQGVTYADDPRNPKSAQIILAEFCFLAGEANEELVLNRPVTSQGEFTTIIARSKEWEELIERTWGERVSSRVCYATKESADGFNINKLEKIVARLDSEYEIKMIDEKLYNESLQQDWCKKLCGNFKDYEEYKEHGLGIMIMQGEEIAAGASSYAYYNDGIEIEIDTNQNHRRRGLASVCGARLILECLKRDLYPNWDAQNAISLKTAEKLGYEFAEEYIAYDIV